MGLTKAPERYMSEIEKLKRRSHQAGKEDKLRALEFMFYAHRAFLVDVDPILSELGFGRAHHRALFLVARWPRTEPHPRDRRLGTALAVGCGLVLAAGLARAIALEPALARALSVLP